MSKKDLKATSKGVAYVKGRFINKFEGRGGVIKNRLQGEALIRGKWALNGGNMIL